MPTKSKRCVIYPVSLTSLASFLPKALSTIPVILQPGVSDRETGFLRYPSLVNSIGDLIIQYLFTLLADQIDMLFKIPFVAVLNLVKLQRLDDAVPGKFAKGRINCGQTQASFLLLCLLIHEARTWMKLSVLNQYLNDSQSLRGNF